MSEHICRPVHVGYSPSCDRKWKPEGMSLEKLYPVFAYENGVLRLRGKDGKPDGTTAEAFYFHFAGDGGRPCRLISSNAVVVLDSDGVVGSDERRFWDEIKKTAGGSGPAVSGDEPGF